MKEAGSPSSSGRKKKPPPRARRKKNGESAPKSPPPPPRVASDSGALAASVSLGSELDSPPPPPLTPPASTALGLPVQQPSENAFVGLSDLAEAAVYLMTGSPVTKGTIVRSRPLPS